MKLIKGYNKMNNLNRYERKGIKSSVQEIHNKHMNNRLKMYSKTLNEDAINNDVNALDYAKNKLIEHSRPNSYKIANMVNVINGLSPKEIVILYNIYC